ncbi:MAG: ferredoxin family protein [Candidatus Bathyarchaeia archaeon]
MSSTQGAVKPNWRGIPREEINWHPTVDPELCIGCGICVLNCGKNVYQFDYEKNVAVVANPMNCLVGCTTCQNTCPQHAISFPPLSYIHKIIKKKGIIQRSREELLANKAKYAVK